MAGDVVVQMADFRDRRQAAAPQEVDPLLADVQMGVNSVTSLVGRRATVQPQMHGEYPLTAIGPDGTTYAAGEPGVQDFVTTFRRIYDAAGHRHRVPMQGAAGVCYGAYGAARCLLPEIIEASTTRVDAYDCLMERYLEVNPSASVDEAMHAVIGRAAATIALALLKPHLDPATKLTMSDQLLRNRFTSDGTVATDFRQHLALRDAAALSGLAVRRSI